MKAWPTYSIAQRILLWSEKYRAMSLVVAVSVLFLLGWTDYVTGYELNLVLFYVFPVMLGAWASGRMAGFCLAATGAGLWLMTDNAAGHVYHEPLSPFWNALMRLGVLILAVQFVLIIKSILADERSRSRTDPLTGIANRRAFFEAMDREISRSRRSQHVFSLAFIDIDSFKLLNDRLGHGEGDRALKLICESLNSALRDIDLVARMGGDEFAVLLPACASDTAREVMARCVDQCTQLPDWGKWGIALSAGVGTFHMTTLSADQMLSHVDQIMYRGKRNGTNSIVVDDFTTETVRNCA